MNAVLDVQNLTKKFGERTAVNGVSFSISTGELFGLLGPNGAGKTTTISIVCGLLGADGGEVQIAGQQMTQHTVQPRQSVGYVPQEIALYPDLTPKENLKFFGRLYGLRGKDLARKVDEALELVGLTERSKDRVGKLSGGMRRRLNIAAGLLHQPALLVLDEPTVGVDAESRKAILDNVADLKEKGMAILYTTHYMEEAERLSDRIGIIDEGQLVATGTRRELVDLVAQSDRVEIIVEGDVSSFAAALERVASVSRVTVSNKTIIAFCAQARRNLPAIISAASSHNVDLRSVDVYEPDLEAVFLHLTNKSLRERGTDKT